MSVWAKWEILQLQSWAKPSSLSWCKETDIIDEVNAPLQRNKHLSCATQYQRVEIQRMVTWFKAVICVCLCMCVCVCLCVLWVTRDQHLNPHPNKGPVTDGWKLHAGILRPFVRELFCGPMRSYQIRFHSNKDQQIYRADRLPKQCHTNNAKWDLMSTHTHTHAHRCPTSEHLLKFCTLKFMLKEKCTCLLKHSEMQWNGGCFCSDLMISQSS